MNFQPELAAKVMAGEKTVTRRLCSTNPRSPWWRGACALKVGRDYAVCPGRGKPAIGRVRVLRAELEHLGQVTTLDAKREGFHGRGEFRRAWEQINGSWSDVLLVWRIEFEVVVAPPLLVEGDDVIARAVHAARGERKRTAAS